MLLQDQQNVISAAAKKAKKAEAMAQASPDEKALLINQQKAIEDAKRKAADDWNAKQGAKLRKIDRELQETPKEGGTIRQHAALLVKPD